MNENHAHDPRIIQLLEDLRETEPRNSQYAVIQRAAFLSEAQNLFLGVSQPRVQRLNKWKAAFTHLFTLPRKERITMFKIAVTIIMLAGLALGSGTLAAAQTSLPNEALYPVKIWTEDFQISLANENQELMRLNLEFANRRFSEIMTLLQTGKTVPENALTRLETQLDNTLILAVNMPDQDARASLAQVQTQLELHQQTMSQFQFQTEVTPPMLQIRERVQNTLELHLGLAKGGAEDPLWLRDRLRIREQDQTNQGEFGNGNAWTTGTPTAGSGYGPGGPGDSQNPWTTPEPGSGYGPGEPGESQNPWTTGTPIPGSGYGPGDPVNPGPSGSPTPGAGYGPGEPGEFQNPWTTGTPIPGSGYGPGPGIEPDFTPPSNENAPCNPCVDDVNGNGNKP